MAKPWRNAVEMMLAEAAADERPANTVEQFLREVVDFANTGKLRTASHPAPPTRREAREVDGARRRLRADLQALVDKRLSDADKKRIFAAADRVLLAPRTGDDGEERYCWMWESNDAWPAHALKLLITSPKFREDLKQCQWKACNLENRIEDDRQLPHVRKFFFVSQRLEDAAAKGKAATGKRPGKRPDTYCCEDHMRAAHSERATEATRARRKKERELEDQKQQAAERAAAKHK